MKRLFKLTLIAAMLFCCHSAQAVYVQNMPVIQFQPNGDTVHMFATGDECYHRFHDSNNYTIVQAPSGWWVYAEADNEKGLKPSSHRAGTVNPATLGITPGLTISRQEWHKRRQAQNQRTKPRRLLQPGHLYPLCRRHGLYPTLLQCRPHVQRFVERKYGVSI